MKILQFAFDGKEDNPYLPKILKVKIGLSILGLMTIQLPSHGGIL